MNLLARWLGASVPECLIWMVALTTPSLWTCDSNSPVRPPKEAAAKAESMAEPGPPTAGQTVNTVSGALSSAEPEGSQRLDDPSAESAITDAWWAFDEFGESEALRNWAQAHGDQVASDIRAAGQVPFYVGVFVIGPDGQLALEHDALRSAPLAKGTIRPDMVPVQALEDMLVARVHVSESTASTGLPGVEARSVAVTVLADEPYLTPPKAGPDGPGTSSAELRESAEQALNEWGDAGPPVDEDGCIEFYLSFDPAIPFDSARRVDWTIVPAGTPVREVLRWGKQLRQLEIQDRVASKVHAIEQIVGCKVIDAGRLNHSAHVRCTAQAIAELIDSVPGILTVQGPTPHQGTGSGGGEYRSFAASQTNLAPNEARVGEGPSSSQSDNIKVAVIEIEGYYKLNQHPAYRDWLNGPSRITRARYCTDSACVTTTGPDWSGPNHFQHGVQVLAAYSHTLQGQDPNMSIVAAREQRSWMAWEADIYATRAAPGTGAFAKAIEDAVDQGADLLQNSIYFSPGTNNPRGVHPDLRDAYDDAYDQGVAAVVLAGNTVRVISDTNSTNGGATRSDMVVVGGFGDLIDGNKESGNGHPFPIKIPYDQLALMYGTWNDISQIINCASTINGQSCPGGGSCCAHTAIGDAEMRYNSSTTYWQRAVVDLVAPGYIDNVPVVDWSNGDNPTYLDDDLYFPGTSVAAPRVAAATVSLLDHFVNTGSASKNDPGLVHNYILMMGDGTYGWAAGTAPGNSRTGIDRLWGTGRFKYRHFSDAGLDGPWRYGTWVTTMTAGQTVFWPLATSTSGAIVNSDMDRLVAVAGWHEENLNPAGAAAAWITFSVGYNDPVGGSCQNPGSGGPSYVAVATDNRFDTHRRVRLVGTVLNPMRGKCAWARLHASTTPSQSNGPGRQVKLTYYLEDGDRECAENLGQCPPNNCPGQPEGCIR